MRTVLVADDDPDVLALTAELLLEDGWWVLEASNATAALAILERDTPIDLMITDVVMPGMDGLELADRAKVRRPTLLVLYVTGYLKEFPERRQGGTHGKLLFKPWRADELKQEVRAALGTAGR